MSRQRSPRALSGRVVLHEGTMLVVEIVLDGALDWRLPSPPGAVARMRSIVTGGVMMPVEVKLSTADGAWVFAIVDLARSTRAGALAAGQVLRLVLELRPEDATKQFVRLELLDGVDVTPIQATL